jgi:ABC-2 type transport system permease protein
MKNLLRLAWVIYKGNGLANFAGDANRKKRKLNRVGSVLLFAFLALYMIAIMVGAAVTFYDILSPAGLQSILVSLFLSMGVILVFLFGILYVISIFYYASDVEKLLPLPLQPEEIIGAKLLVTAAYEYIFIRSGAGLLFYLYGLIVFLVLPVIPLCFASLISMLIMRFTKFARNKDRFNMISGILALVLALAVVFGSQSMMTLNPNDLAGLLSKSAGDIAGLTASAFPGTALAAAALADSSSWLAAGQLGLLVLIAAAILGITMGLSRFLYFQGVIGLGASAASHRRLTARELTDAGTGGPAFWTYVWKDIRILLRTPIFFMNNVLMNFLWPVFFLIPLALGKQDQNIDVVIQLLRKTTFGPDGQGVPLALAIAFGAACFISGTNGIAQSALSREGKLLYIMKILPMSYTRQIWAKLTVGILMSLIGTLLLAIILIVMIQPPFWFVLLLLAVLPGAILTTNLAGIIFELYWPKLNWDNEQKAVKQNLNVIYGILLAMLLAALVIVPVTVFGLALLPAALLTCVVPLLLSLALALTIHRIGPRLLISLNV